MNLTKLTGTEKQIAWAETIRKDMIENWKSFKEKETEEVYEKILIALTTEKQASSFIEALKAPINNLPEKLRKIIYLVNIYKKNNNIK